MLTLLKRWLGWEADRDFYGNVRPNVEPRRPNSATAHLFAKRNPVQARTARPVQKNGKKAPTRSVPARPAAQPRPAAKPAAQTRPTAAARPAAQPRPAAPKRAAALAVGKGKLNPGAAAARAKPKVKPQQFDPYNTGKFDRGASWERISKSQR